MSGPLDRRRFAEAMAAYRDVMSAYVRRKDVPADYVKHLGAGSQNMNRLGRYWEAYEIIQLILEGVGYIRDPNERALRTYYAWRSKASTSSFLGLWRESIGAYGQAISLGEGGVYAALRGEGSGRASPDMVCEPADYRELGSMYGRIGAFGQARENFAIAAERLEEIAGKLGDHAHRDEMARLHNARALVHMDLGEYEEAEGDALSAARIQEALGEVNPLRFLQAAIDYVTVGRARRELARREDEGYASSFEAFGDALRVLDLVPDEDRDREHPDRKSEAHLERGRTHMLNGDYDAAIADLGEARLLTSSFNLVQHAGEHDLYLGEACLELGDLPCARERLEEAVGLAERHGTPETLWQGQFALALLLRAEGQLEQARSKLRACIETIERLRSQHLPEASKISMLDLKDRPYEELIVDLCGSAGVGAEAFRYVESAKSRVLAEQLASRDLGKPAGVPAELLNEERELAGALRAVQDPGSRANAARGAYDRGARVEEAERRLREIRDRIRASGPRGEEYVALREAAPLDYEGARGMLASRAHAGSSELAGCETSASGRGRRMVLVDYFVAEDKVFVFVGRADFEAPHLYQVDVSRYALEAWAEVFASIKPRNYLALWDLEAWQREMGELVEPIEECSEEGDVVWIVPHRELHHLPLHALELGGQYLADRNPVFYTPSASAFRYSRAKNRGQVPETAVVLGDSLPGEDALPSAAEEAIIVAALFDTDAYLGDRATKSALYEELRRAGGDVDVLHLACHGKFEPEAPLESRIELAPDTEGDDEEPDLTARDVLDLDLKATIVTLSACESGLSKIRPGEELVGLTRSFLYAGTPSLLVSLWSVADESTGVLMRRFYEALLGHPSGSGARARTSKVQALRAAQQTVRSNARFDHPFHWSSFVLVGDWQ